ncbi:MAG: S-methyl-5-thioribose-1-phosphate isomerase [Bacteroidales bacterium]
MEVNGKHYRTIWVAGDDEKSVRIIDQRHLPHKFVTEDLRSLSELAAAIREMHLRGAGLIGAAAAYGMWLASLEAPEDPVRFDNHINEAAERLRSARPTAVNLSWAVGEQIARMAKGTSVEEKREIARTGADEIADSDSESCRMIGEYGVGLIEEVSRQKEGGTVNILTHCNAGWLAFVDWGTALSPVYMAHDKGIKVHVWVDETRPRNQGSSLTAWELGQHGVEHTVIADNAGGHLMQQRMVDMVIVGSDRTTITGDVANKTGTYLKALAANDNGVPFYVALPSSSIDWEIEDGIRQITIEERGADEVRYLEGLCEDGNIRKVLLTPEGSKAVNYAFDITPARLVTALITERGICGATREEILSLFPEKSIR